MATASHIDSPPRSLAPGIWHVVPDGSELGVTTRMLLRLARARGRFTDLGGELHIGSNGTATGALEIPAETIGTGIRKRDTHLRSTDFLYVGAPPHLWFELADLRPRESRAARLASSLHKVETPSPRPYPSTTRGQDQ